MGGCTEGVWFRACGTGRSGWPTRSHRVGDLGPNPPKESRALPCLLGRNADPPGLLATQESNSGAWWAVLGLTVPLAPQFDSEGQNGRAGWAIGVRNPRPGPGKGDPGRKRGTRVAGCGAWPNHVSPNRFPRVGPIGGIPRTDWETAGKLRKRSNHSRCGYRFENSRMNPAVHLTVGITQHLIPHPMGSLGVPDDVEPVGVEGFAASDGGVDFDTVNNGGD